MKFRDKNGFDYSDIEMARWEFCGSKDCDTCPLRQYDNRDCVEFSSKNPAKAAELMGYDIILESGIDFPMPGYNPDDVAFTTFDNADKHEPRICKVLNVKVGERFQIDYPKGTTAVLHVNEDGLIEREGGPNRLKIGNSIAWAINHPESVIRIPTLSKDEWELVNNIEKVFQPGPSWKVERDTCGNLWVDCEHGRYPLWNKLLPSLWAGHKINVYFN